MQALHYLRRPLVIAFTLLALTMAAPYVWAPVYRFPTPVPFSGNTWWNPYERLDDTTWQRANFHAHGRAWFGLTNGRQPDADIVARYRALGYQVPTVSNYQRIADRDAATGMPAYEHGYNITKSHQVAIGARRVEWFDFPLWQGTGHQQYVIDRVKANTSLLALAHPATRNAYSYDDLAELSGYDLIEVANGPFTAADRWDAALSSGHPVWAVGDDDTHDILDPQRTAAAWTMVAASSPHVDDIVPALQRGHSYVGVRRGAVGSVDITTVRAVQVREGRLDVSLEGAPSTVTFVGQHGVVRKVDHNVIAASYTPADADTYVRVVVDTPQTQLFLNPILRVEGEAPRAPRVVVDQAATWTWRASSGTGVLFVCYLLIRRRRPSPIVQMQPALARVAKRHTA